MYNPRTITVNKKSYTVDDNMILGSGGEATVYNYSSHQAVKVFNSANITQNKISKVKQYIKAGINIPNFAFPTDLVTENGNFAGYVMPKVNAQNNLNHLIKQSNQKLAVQLCIKLYEDLQKLHLSGILLGDLNPQNFYYDNSGNVHYIDTDAWGLNGIAPDSQWSDYVDTLLTEGKYPTACKQSEMYGLTCLIFQLITGYNPWSYIHPTHGRNNNLSKNDRKCYLNKVNK